MRNSSFCDDKQENIMALVLDEFEGSNVDLQNHLETCPDCGGFLKTMTDEETMVSSTLKAFAEQAVATQISLAQPYEPHPSQAKTQDVSKSRRLTDGSVTSHPLFKVAAILILAVVFVGIFTLFTQTTGPLAFAEVLKTMQQNDYAVDVTIQLAPDESYTSHILVSGAGRMRTDNTFDDLDGNVTTITDYRTKTLMIIYHQQKIVRFIDQNQTEGFETLDFLTRPVNALWNLRDGSEQPLEDRMIDKQLARGFHVSQTYADYQLQLNIWAHPESAEPLLIEGSLILNSRSDQPINITLGGFDLDVEFDQSTFSFEPPPGYIEKKYNNR